MTKRELVTRISEETGLVQHEVREVVQKTLDHIREAIENGDRVELRNFGVFKVKERRPRMGRNPNAPQTEVPVPPGTVVKFKPGKEMREGASNLRSKRNKTRRRHRTASSRGVKGNDQ